ncbi:hypothetical protein [Cellulomonas denverensis]|uniref:hypothetical protein n=1 Tax=Cellulomonas denverensis TaxID=264297 RepID=UPI0035E6C11F
MAAFYADVTETLAVFWDTRPHTRAELHRVTGRARNTVTKHLDLLVRHRLILAAGKDPAATGLPSERFRLNPAAGAVAVVQAEGERARLTVADLAGRVRGRCTVAADLLAPGLSRAAATFLPGAPLLTVLLTGPGAARVDAAQLADDLPARVQVRPWAELALAGQGATGTVLCLDLDGDLRAATLLDGRMVAGAGGVAGRIGGLVLPTREPALGPACHRSLDEVLAVARSAPDRPVVQLAAGRHVGHAVATFCRLVDPDAVLVAGRPAHDRAFWSGLCDAVTAGASPIAGHRTELRPVRGDLPTAIARGGCHEARRLTGSVEGLTRLLRAVDGPRADRVPVAV